MKIACTPLRNRTACRGAVVLPMLLLTACAGTLHSRWAGPADSVDAWQPRIQAMPIEVHGAAPGASAAATLAAVNHGLNDAGRRANASDQRIVLYVGGNTLPANDTYCQGAPSMRNVVVSARKVLFASALCDGPRVVVTDRREVAPGQLDANHIAQAVKRSKTLLMFGLATSRAQPPEANQCTNDLAGKQC